MKYLNDYTQEKTTKLLDNLGAFFAFSKKQFDEQMVPGTKYVNMNLGMICPKQNVIKMNYNYMYIVKEGIKQDIRENGKEGIIIRELYNHEAFYTGNIEDTHSCLDGYNITMEEVRKAFYKELPNADL